MSEFLAGSLDREVPSVVVVDPRFDAYKPLATSARLGKITLHFRSSGAEAVKLARRLRVDAWLIAPELDDMSGHDLVPLLQSQIASQDRVQGKVAVVTDSVPGSRPWALAKEEAHAAGATIVPHPITFSELESLIGLPAEERARIIPAAGPALAFVTLPMGVGAAMIAIAMLMMN
jgi:hypothetical protein